jgi:hypothetical protein
MGQFEDEQILGFSLTNKLALPPRGGVLGKRGYKKFFLPCEGRFGEGSSKC